MSQDRFTSEGGRNIVWTAVQEALNAYRRDGGRVISPDLFIKFEKRLWREPATSVPPWRPGAPDEPQINEEDIQRLIADIAADVCKRVETALDRIDPRELTKPVKPPSATDRAASRGLRVVLAESGDSASVRGTDPEDPERVELTARGSLEVPADCTLVISKRIYGGEVVDDFQTDDGGDGETS